MVFELLLEELHSSSLRREGSQMRKLRDRRSRESNSGSAGFSAAKNPVHLEMRIVTREDTWN